MSIDKAKIEAFVETFLIKPEVVFSETTGQNYWCTVPYSIKAVYTNSLSFEKALCKDPVLEKYVNAGRLNEVMGEVFTVYQARIEAYRTGSKGKAIQHMPGGLNGAIHFLYLCFTEYEVDSSAVRSLLVELLAGLTDDPTCTRPDKFSQDQQVLDSFLPFFSEVETLKNSTSSTLSRLREIIAVSEDKSSDHLEQPFDCIEYALLRAMENQKLIIDAETGSYGIYRDSDQEPHKIASPIVHMGSCIQSLIWSMKSCSELYDDAIAYEDEGKQASAMEILQLSIELSKKVLSTPVIFRDKSGNVLQSETFSDCLLLTDWPQNPNQIPKASTPKPDTIAKYSYESKQLLVEMVELATIILSSKSLILQSEQILQLTTQIAALIGDEKHQSKALETLNGLIDGLTLVTDNPDMSSELKTLPGNQLFATVLTPALEWLMEQGDERRNIDSKVTSQTVELVTKLVDLALKSDNFEANLFVVQKIGNAQFFSNALRNAAPLNDKLMQLRENTAWQAKEFALKNTVGTASEDRQGLINQVYDKFSKGNKSPEAMLELGQNHPEQYVPPEGFIAKFFRYVANVFRRMSRHQRDPVALSSESFEFSRSGRNLVTGETPHEFFLETLKSLYSSVTTVEMPAPTLTLAQQAAEFKAATDAQNAQAQRKRASLSDYSSERHSTANRERAESESGQPEHSGARPPHKH